MTVYKIPASEPHLNWLEQFANVKYVEGDGDYHLRAFVMISEAMAMKFNANFKDFEIID